MINKYFILGGDGERLGIPHLSLKNIVHFL